jgi:hypothetical protein
VVFPDSYSVATGTYFRGIKRQGSQVYDSSPPSAEVKEAVTPSSVHTANANFKFANKYTVSGKFKVPSTLKYGKHALNTVV